MPELTRWVDTLTLRPEIATAGGNINNDLQMSLFHAVHEPDRTPYSDVGYYSDITHPTQGLKELMGAIAVRLAAPTNAGAVKAVWRGDQGMGGGKSHAEVGLFHMANDPEAFFNTQLGEEVAEHAAGIAGEAIPTDLENPTVVVLPCDKMDPFKPDKDIDNIAETLGERWLWRLVGGDLDQFKALRDGLGTPPGITAAMDAVGGRVVTLVDEVLNYIRKATADGSYTDRAQQDMAFLRDLMDAVNTSDHCAMVVVMIASDDDTVAMGEFGERIRTEMEDILHRYGRSIATTSGGDFAEIIRRRLFVAPPEADVIDATAAAFKQHVVAGWSDQFGQFAWWTDGWADNVERTYPFHPSLIDLVEREWANRSGFQKVRSTIQIFAAAVHKWIERGDAGEWTPPLIGLGDLPLSDTKVRESIIDSGVIPDSKVIANYREIAANDVVDPAEERGSARRIDLERGDGLLNQINPRAAERIATSMYVCSLAPRAQGDIGATEAELRVAAYVPAAACDLADIDGVLGTLELPDKGIATLDIKPGKGGKPRRLVMSTTQTLQMFFRTQRQAVTQQDIDKVLRDMAQAEMTAGPFSKNLFVSAEEHVEPGAKGEDLTSGLIAALESAGIDSDETRLLVLDPSAFTLLNGVDAECRMAISVALGLKKPVGWTGETDWPTPMDVPHASSCVFSVVNTQRRGYAVAAVTDYVAWQRVSEIPNVSSDESLVEQARAEVADKRNAVRTNLRKAFQHIVYLGDGREAVTVRLDKDNQTALDGTIVWKTLADRDKTFDRGDFDKTALLWQLRNEDSDGPTAFGKPLKTIRGFFYKDPRRPLLHDGDTDLKNAIYAAVASGDVTILDSSGSPAVPKRPADVNLTSTGYTLELPQPETPTGQPDVTGIDPPPYDTGDVHDADAGNDEPTDTPKKPGGTPPQPPEQAAEAKVTFSLMGSAFDHPGEPQAARQLFQALADAFDEDTVTYGKFTVEVTVPQAAADEVEAAAENISNLNHNRTDV